MYGITSDDIWTKWTHVYNHWTSCEKRSMRCGVICHSSMSNVWFTVYAEESGRSYCDRWWLQTLHCYSVIIVKFLFVYLPLRDLILIYRFLSLYMFTQINKLIAGDSSYRFSIHFLFDCLRYSASCTKSGNFWTLRLGTLENNHNTPGLSISFQFCRKLTKHLLYHIANFDGGTQCVIWGVICIFMKSSSCSSGCTPSPWTWSVLRITGVFSVSSQYTVHRSLRHLHCLGNVRYCSPRCFHPNGLSSLADGTFPNDEVKLTGHKKLTFGVAKVVLVSILLFKDYIVIFTHFCQSCYQVYVHHIENFSGNHSMSNTMKNKFGKFLQELFSRGVYTIVPSVKSSTRCGHFQLIQGNS